jgi:hypothetical protein
VPPPDIDLPDDTGAVAITITPGADVVVGQAVHFRVSPLSISALAAAAGISTADFEETSETFWEYSTGDARENYPFEGLPADHLGGRTAGWSLGQFGAHVYAHAGTHTVRIALYRLGALVAQGERAIVVTAREHALADQGYLAAALPVAGADGVPVGATNLFTDIHAALEWLCAAPTRALYLRRGAVFSLTQRDSRNLPTDATLGAYDATGPHGTTGARPVVNVNFGIAGARIDAIAAGGTESFTGESLSAEIYVYAENTRLEETVGYTRGVHTASDTITVLSATPGARIRVFNVGKNGRPVLSSSAVLRLGGNARQIVRDIDFLGGYDAANPGSFDRDDLSTLNHWVMQQGIVTGTDNVNNATVFRCSVRHFAENFTFAAGAGDMLALVDVNFSYWANYGIYISKVTRSILLGCDIRQNMLARNSAQRKAFNTPVQVAGSEQAALNAPWHGPIRIAYCVESVIGSCRLDSRTSWAGNNEDRAQPVARLVQSSKPGQSYAFVQSHTTGGQGCFGGGAKNEQDVLGPSGLCDVGYNVFVSYPAAERFGSGSVRVRSISNVYLIPADTGASTPFQVFNGQSESTLLARASVSSAPWRSINDTMLVLDDRATTLDLNPSYTLASPGMYAIASVTGDFPPGTDKSLRPPLGGYPVPSSAWGTATVRVPLSVKSNSAVSGFATRIWRGPDQPGAVSEPTVTTQANVYTYQYPGLAPNTESTDRSLKDAEYVDVTLRSGTWAAGDIVWITRELTEETAGQVEFADPDDGEEGEDGVLAELVIGTAETFVPNNRAVPLVRGPATLHNVVLLIGGTWTTVRIADAAVDPAPYAPEIFGTWDGSWRPAAGNSAIDTASGIRAAFDVRGWLRTGNSLGALEPDTDLTGWPALPVQAPAVSVALSPAGYVEGDAFDADNVSVAITAAGSPALLTGDVTKIAEVQDALGAVVSTAGSSALEAGQRVIARADYTHVTVPRRRLATAPAVVQATNFAPVWVNSNPALVSPYNGARVNYVGLSAPPAAANQHLAFRFRNRHAEAGIATARLWNATAGVVNGPRLGLTSTGALNATDVGTSTTLLCTVPNNGGVCSLLLSSYLAGDGPGGVGLQARIKIGDGPVQTVPIPGPAKNILGTAFRLFSATQGTADLDFRQFVGMWTGGRPDWSDFFETDGEVRNWAIDPTLGVSGMQQHCILNGLGGAELTNTFNGHLDSGAWPWLAGAV